jgi:TolB-like protein
MMSLVCDNRGAGFDGGVGPIVRVEPGRLRRRLCTYYETEGSGDPIVIELPQRTYIPVFRRREEPCAVAIPARSREQPSAALPIEPGSRVWKRIAVVGPILLVSAAAGCAMWMARNPSAGHTPGGGAAEARSIVVLPFTDATPKQEVEHFSEGLSEEITERLNKIAGLRVVSHLTAFSIRGKAADAREIGRQANAGFVLDGSVRRSGDRLRVNVCLVDASEGYDIWSRTYDREFKEGFATEEGLAAAIVADLREKLSGAGRATRR